MSTRAAYGLAEEQANHEPVAGERGEARVVLPQGLQVAERTPRVGASSSTMAGLEAAGAPEGVPADRSTVTRGEAATASSVHPGRKGTPSGGRSRRRRGARATPGAHELPSHAGHISIRPRIR